MSTEMIEKPKTAWVLKECYDGEEWDVVGVTFSSEVAKEWNKKKVKKYGFTTTEVPVF
jgi:hypothetical protein